MRKEDIFTVSIEDFFSLRVLLISVISLAITFGIVAGLIYVSVENFNGVGVFVSHYVGNLYESILKKIEDIPLLSVLIEHELIMYVIRYVIIFGIGTALYYLFFTLYGIVIGWFSGFIVSMVRERHYADIALKGIGIFYTIYFYVRTILVTVVIFIVLIPLYFIPVLNFVLLLAPYYFFHKTTVFDVASVINNIVEYKKIKSVNWSELKGVTGLCFGLSLIPVVGILLYPLYVILVSHYMFRETEELRAVTHFHTP